MRMHYRIGLLLAAAALVPACRESPTEPQPASVALFATRVQGPVCNGAQATLWAGMPEELIPNGAIVRLREHGGAWDIRGTASRDVIVGSNGSDRLRGRGGNDLICAGEGDMVWGNEGNDHIVAHGAAFMRGGAGNDRIIGGAGDDRMLGGPGNDVLFGGPGSDFFGGCGGHDVAQDFDATRDHFSGSVETGIPAGTPHEDMPPDEDGCSGGGDHEDGGCGGGNGDHDEGGCGGSGGDHEEGGDHEDGGCGGGGEHDEVPAR